MINREVRKTHAGLNLEKETSYTVNIPNTYQEEDLLSGYSSPTPMAPKHNISALSSVRKINQKADLQDISIIT